jgi:hypothetical protein
MVDPRPWFNVYLNFKSWTINWPIETAFASRTRLFTSVYLLISFLLLYLVGLALLARAHAFRTPAKSFIGCTSTYWAPDEACGLDGEQCAPFDNSTFEFRCPARCADTILENPRAVGNLEPVFVPLVVGGGDPRTGNASGVYRGDSFLCAAAIHA